jgi:hypothetical protein
MTANMANMIEVGIFMASDLDKLAMFYHPDVAIYEGGGINNGCRASPDHTERDTRVDGHIRERDLVSVWRHWLQRDAREVAPARMRVRRGDAVDACLCRRRKVESSGRGAHEYNADSGRRRTGARRRRPV